MYKKEQGEMYRKDVLSLLARVGYASTRQIAKGVWKRCDVSTRKMAGRTLRWLLNQRLIVCKREGDGVVNVNTELLYALTSKGAAATRQFGSPLVADKVHARDYLKSSHSHRTQCNSVYVALPNQRIWSELEIRAKRSGLNSFTYASGGVSYSKIPDLIAVTPDNRWEWIEVENSWRSDKDLVKIRDCIRDMYRRENHIGCVHFVVTSPGARTIGRRLAKLMTPKDFNDYLLTGELDKRILRSHIKVSLLNQQTLSLLPIDIGD
jgi:Holliday junction resolvase